MMKQRIVAAAGIAVGALMIACEQDPAEDTPEANPPAAAPEASDTQAPDPRSADAESVDLPTELTRRRQPPDPELLLPPLDGYETDDAADPGELEASLDHGPVPYAEIRRRLVLDEDGFTAGEITVVTLQPDREGGRAYLDHRYGDVPRSALRIAGQEMLRVEAAPHAAIAWIGPTFVVTFERGQEVTEDWLEELAAQTVWAIAR